MSGSSLDIIGRRRAQLPARPNDVPSSGYGQSLKVLPVSESRLGLRPHRRNSENHIHALMLRILQREARFRESDLETVSVLPNRTRTRLSADRLRSLSTLNARQQVSCSRCFRAVTVGQQGLATR